MDFRQPLGFVQMVLHQPASVFWRMTPMEFNSAYDQYLDMTFSNDDLGKMGIIRVDSGNPRELSDTKKSTPWGNSELVEQARRLVEEVNV